MTTLSETVPVPAMPMPQAVPELSARELQVLRGMALGMSNRKIGADLHLTEDTVKTHARRMFRKLGVVDRAHAVYAGCRIGLLPLDAPSLPPSGSPPRRVGPTHRASCCSLRCDCDLGRTQNRGGPARVKTPRAHPPPTMFRF